MPSDGSIAYTRIWAESISQARRLLSNQFGKGSVLNVFETSQLSETDQQRQQLDPKDRQISAVKQQTKQITQQANLTKAQRDLTKAQNKLRQVRNPTPTKSAGNEQ